MNDAIRNMKQFFYLAFGGTLMVFFGIAVAYAGSRGYDALRGLPSLPWIQAAASADAATGAQISAGSSASTVVSGLARVIRYTADEEENMISAAALSLPSGSAPGIAAKAYIVEDLSTGAVVAGQNETELLPIASLTKLVTAVVARDLIQPDAPITITESIMSTYGNTAQFRQGETLTAGDLYYPLLMVSSNDAAEAFAQYYGRAKFIAAMNAFTQSIGAYRTYFADPSGLSPQNVSTASDMALILRWIRANDPELLAITLLKTKTVRSHTWDNPTHFLAWSYYLGGKNGYLPEAEETGASLFALGPSKDAYAVVVLGSPDRDTDVIKLLAKVGD